MFSAVFCVDLPDTEVFRFSPSVLTCISSGTVVFIFATLQP